MAQDTRSPICAPSLLLRICLSWFSPSLYLQRLKRSRLIALTLSLSLHMLWLKLVVRLVPHHTLIDTPTHRGILDTACIDHQCSLPRFCAGRLMDGYWDDENAVLMRWLGQTNSDASITAKTMNANVIVVLVPLTRSNCSPKSCNEIVWTLLERGQWCAFE